MNDRTLLTLGLLMGVGSGKPPEQWLSSLQQVARERQAQNPMQSVLLTVLAGSAAFYAAERGHNPKIKTFYDALVYVATNLSVGYSDIFACTDAGKTIGAALMAYGPALASRAFDPPREAERREQERARSEATLRDIADKLERILVELQSSRGEAPAHG